MERERGGDPHTVVPGRSNQTATLFCTPSATLVACCFDAYPFGLEFCLRLLTARVIDGRNGWPLDLIWSDPAEQAQPVRLWVEFSDGRQWSALDPGPGFPISSDREDIVVIPQGGGGGSHFWEARFKLWPLPPAGPLTFSADWPSEGIVSGSGAIDAGELLELARRATTIELPQESSSSG